MNRKKPKPQFPAMLLALLLITSPATAFSYNWPQFNGAPSHSGNNTLKKTIGPNNVGGLKMLFKVRSPAVADGAPVYVASVKTSRGSRDLLYVTTKEGRLVALDAKTGARQRT
jgi:glucose dehydrogenase